MKFVIYHPYNFTNHKSAILLSFAKFFIIFCIELAADASVIFVNDSGVSIITTFTAFVIINDLADGYFHSLANDPLKQQFMKANDAPIYAFRNLANFKPEEAQTNQVISESIDETPISDLETGTIATVYNDLIINRICQALYSLVDIFIDLIYFYFFPFLIFCLYAIFLQVAKINRKYTAPKDAPPSWDVDFS